MLLHALHIRCHMCSTRICIHTPHQAPKEALKPCGNLWISLAGRLGAPAKNALSRARPSRTNAYKRVYRICAFRRVDSNFQGLESYYRLGLQDGHSFISFCIWWNCLRVPGWNGIQQDKPANALVASRQYSLRDFSANINFQLLFNRLNAEGQGGQIFPRFTRGKKLQSTKFMQTFNVGEVQND